LGFFEDLCHLQCHYGLNEVRVANMLLNLLIPNIHYGLYVQPHILVDKTFWVAFFVNQVLEVHFFGLSRDMGDMDCFENSAEGLTCVCHGMYVEVPFIAV